MFSLTLSLYFTKVSFRKGDPFDCSTTELSATPPISWTAPGRLHKSGQVHEEQPMNFILKNHRWPWVQWQCFSWALCVYFREIPEGYRLFFGSFLRKLPLNCMKTADTWSSWNLGCALIWPIRGSHLGVQSARGRFRRQFSRFCCSSHWVEKDVIVVRVFWWYIAKAWVADTFHGNTLRWATLGMAVLVNIAISVKETNPWFDLIAWRSRYLWDSLRSCVILSYCGALSAWPGVDKRR